MLEVYLHFGDGLEVSDQGRLVAGAVAFLEYRGECYVLEESGVEGLDELELVDLHAGDESILLSAR